MALPLNPTKRWQLTWIAPLHVHRKAVLTLASAQGHVVSHTRPGTAPMPRMMPASAHSLDTLQPEATVRNMTAIRDGTCHGFIAELSMFFLALTVCMDLPEISTDF